MGTFLDVVGPGYPPARLVGLVNPFAVALMLEAGKDQKICLSQKVLFVTVLDKIERLFVCLFLKGAFKNFIKKPIQGFKTVKQIHLRKTILALPEFC